MKPFNIDELIPDYRPALVAPKRKLTAAEKRMFERSQRIYTAHPYNRPVDSYPGVKPEAILNWRAIEKRMAQINEMWKIANGVLWGTLKLAHEARGLEPKDSLYVFTEPDWILRYEARGISHEDPVRLAKELIEGGRNPEKMVVIKYEEGGREIGRMEHKANRLHRMFTVYERILHRAIQDRLQVHLDRTRDAVGENVTHPYYYPPTVYIIENEGRMMIAQSDSMGRLSWINGDVMISEKGGNDERAKIAA
jgi:hypothetical protein